MTLPEPYATTEALKDRIRACTTLAQVEASAREIAPDAKTHEALDPIGVAQLRQLIAYQRMSIDKGWMDEVLE